MRKKDQHKLTGEELSRRDFLKDVSLGVVGVGILTSQLSCSGLQVFGVRGDSREEKFKMAYRKLGRTGLMVSEIGLGGHFRGTDWENTWEDISPEQKQQRVAVFKECLKWGINYFDTNYEFERKLLGLALKSVPGIREKIIIETDINDFSANTGQEVYDLMMKMIDVQLNNLQLPYVDVLRFTAVNKRTTPERLEGAIRGFIDLKRDGKVKFLAVSQHNPDVLLEWINKYDEIEIIYVIYNYFASLAEEELFPEAKKKDLGVVIIKPFNKGTIFDPKLSESIKEWQFVRSQVERLGDKQKDRTRKDLIQGTNLTLAQAGLRYILSNEAVSTVIPGMDNVDHVRENVRVVGDTKFGNLDRGILEQYVAHFENVLPADYSWLTKWKRA